VQAQLALDRPQLGPQALSLRRKGIDPEVAVRGVAQACLPECVVGGHQFALRLADLARWIAMKRQPIRIRKRAL